MLTFEGQKFQGPQVTICLRLRLTAGNAEASPRRPQSPGRRRSSSPSPLSLSLFPFRPRSAAVPDASRRSSGS